MTYSIKKLADLAGVSTRTLRYYDEFGLLKPSKTNHNGYRQYNHKSLLQLQQILFYRELDVPLKDIHLIMKHPDFTPIDALEDHRISLTNKATRLLKLIETIDITIATLQGETEMKDQEYFEGFDETQFEDEVKERWGKTTKVAESQKKWGRYTKDQKGAIKAEGGEISVRMVTKDPNTSPDDPGVQEAVGDYYVFLNKYFYTCEVSFLRNLADMWVEDPRFAVNYERIREGGAEFVRQAVHIYCDRNN